MNIVTIKNERVKPHDLHLHQRIPLLPIIRALSFILQPNSPADSGPSHNPSNLTLDYLVLALNILLPSTLIAIQRSRCVLCKIYKIIFFKTFRSKQTPKCRLMTKCLPNTHSKSA